MRNRWINLFMLIAGATAYSNVITLFNLSMESLPEPSILNLVTCGFFVGILLFANK